MAITKVSGEYLYTPPGTILVTAHNTNISGYIKCNGAAIDRIAYKKLFDSIGTTYGSGNGSTTFNIPDYRGTFLRGLDESRNFDSGRAMGTYQADSFISHVHGGLFSGPTGTSATSGGYWIFASNLGSSTGSNGGTETRPRNIAMIFHIKF